MEIAEKFKFEIKSYYFEAEKEDLRKPRIVKIGAIQHSIASSTSDPISTQRNSIFEKIGMKFFEKKLLFIYQFIEFKVI